jgi:iron complex transport system substrate-binding protein
VLAVLLLAVGCTAPAGGDPRDPPSRAPAASPGPSGPAPTPIILTDDAGRTIDLSAEPERIVSLAPSNTEIVCALGACERLVGVTDADDYPPEVTGIEPVVVQTAVDVEKVVATEPDLVLAAGNELTPGEVIDQLDGLGLAVMVLYPESVGELYADIELVGKALGEPSAADRLVSDLEQRAEAVVETVSGAERPRTFYEVFYSDAAIYTAGEGSFIAELIGLAGGEPVTGDAQGLIDPEEIVTADPELILLGSASYDPALADAETALGTVSARPGWADLSAVREGRVVPYTEDLVTTRPGPRIMEGLEALARAIHPDRFGD